MAHLHWFDVVGYLGAVLMFSTFYMKTMIPLRVVGIAANVCMVVFAGMTRSYPVLVLQACLLPLNVVRLLQMRRLIAQVQEASSSDFRFDALIPYMTAQSLPAGAALFRKGDAGDKLFLVKRGAVRLEELGRVLGPGEVLGEIGIFSPQRKRTATAVCAEATELFSITADQVMQIYYQNPRFGFFLVRLVIERLTRPAGTDPKPAPPSS